MVLVVEHDGEMDQVGVLEIAELCDNQNRNQNQKNKRISILIIG